MPRSLGLFLTIVLFTVWTVAVLTPISARVDQMITIMLQRAASPALDVAFSLITVVGNIEVSALLALLTGVALIRSGRARTAAAVWTLFAGGSAFEWLAKHHFPHPGVPLDLQRPGINVWHHVFHTPFGFPSGHAFRTLLLASAASLLSPPWGGVPQRRLRSALVLVVILMGLALVYLGDHWTSEVIGGYLLATPCILVIRGTFEAPSTS